MPNGKQRNKKIKMSVKISVSGQSRNFIPTKHNDSTVKEASCTNSSWDRSYGIKGFYMNLTCMMEKLDVLF